jgi:hypothetical protein
VVAAGEIEADVGEVTEVVVVVEVGVMEVAAVEAIEVGFEETGEVVEVEAVVVVHLKISASSGKASSTHSLCLCVSA